MGYCEIAASYTPFPSEIMGVILSKLASASQLIYRMRIPMANTRISYPRGHNANGEIDLALLQYASSLRDLQLLVTLRTSKPTI